MKTRLTCLLAFTLTLLPATVNALASGDVVAEATSTTAKTLTRIYDHVVIKGEQLAPLLGTGIPRMTLYASDGGQMGPIPFQIDEITDDGQWVLPHASPYPEDLKAGAGKLVQDDPPLTLDGNDELVFMIKDAGDRADAATFPAGWIDGVEIELEDERIGEKGWVYLLKFDEPQPPSDIRYVQYDLEAGYKADRIRTPIHTTGFHPDVPITYAFMNINKPCGTVDNIVDRMKIRMWAKLFGVINFRRTEEDMDSRLWQYKEGPVRLIRMVRSSIRMVSRLQSPEVASYSLYYKNATVLPFRVTLPFDARYVTNDAQFIGAVDMRGRYGWRVRFKSDPNWLTVTGQMCELGRNLRVENADWAIVSGPDGTFMMYLQGLEKYNLVARAVYNDNDKEAFPPEFEKGEVPLVGFHVEGLESLKRGTMEFNVLVFLVTETLGEDDYLRLVEVLDNPVSVSVRGVERAMASR